MIEPRYPRGAELAAIGQAPSDPTPSGLKIRNVWRSRSKGAEIYIWNEPDGSLQWGMVPAFHGLNHALSTLGVSDAWGIEQESKALHLLGTLVTHRQFKHYLLTGSFLERSKRSGLTYLFRKLRPTVAIDARENGPPRYYFGDTEAKPPRGSSRILACLCMHPIGYYSESWGGAMCPTDDVVAHLMLMRGDEPMFWRRCNQHSPDTPQAGL